MIIYNKFANLVFLIIFSFVPISILIGSSVSLISVLLLSLYYVLTSLKKDFSYLLNEKTILILILLNFYLIFNSLISIDFNLGFFRNFGFVRYILLFLAINYFIKVSNNLDKVFKFWTLILLIVFFDVFYEFFNGQNILGFVSENKKRIVSFFKDEQVVGAFLNGFIFVIIGFLFQKFEEKKNYEKFLIILFVFLAILSMIFTGERSNTIKLIFGLAIFFYFNDKIKLKHKIIFVFSFIFSFFIIFNHFFSISEQGHLKHRYYNDLVQRITNKEKRETYIYFILYKSGIEVFKHNPIFGVGNKNYRVESCLKENRKSSNYLCATHPHQIYFEFLSEHGLFGTLILLSILFYLIFKNYKKMIIKKNLIQLGCFCYLLTNFIPFVPGGSFFADFNSTFFWVNFSIYYAINAETNIFNKK